MNETLPSVRVAAVQAAPVLFDREATIAKLGDLAADAEGNLYMVMLGMRPCCGHTLMCR